MEEDQYEQVDFDIPEIPDTLLPDGQEELPDEQEELPDGQEEAEEEVSGPPAGTTMVANNQPEREEADVLPDGKVVDGKKWKTKTGEKKKARRKRK